MEIPEQKRGGRQRAQGRRSDSDAAAQIQVERREEKESRQRHQQASGDFQSEGRREARFFQSGGKSHQTPDGQMAPVHFTAVGGVVGRGVAQAPVAGLAEIAGIGEPEIGIGINEAARLPPGVVGVDVRGRGGGVALETPERGIYSPAHSAEPQSQQKQGQGHHPFGGGNGWNQTHCFHCGASGGALGGRWTENT